MQVMGAVSPTRVALGVVVSGPDPAPVMGALRRNLEVDTDGRRTMTNGPNVHLQGLCPLRA